MPDQIRESFKFESAGAQTVAANKDRWIATFNGQVIGTEAVVGTAPAGSALIFDVLKNGTSIYATATKPTVADAATKTASVFAPDADPANRFVTGDVLSLSVTQIGSGTAGSDADVVVEYVAT